MYGLPKEYIDYIIPAGMKKGEELIKEGMEIGKTFEANYPKFYLAKGLTRTDEYMKSVVAKGEFAGFSVNIGMATKEETLNACIELYEWGKKNGIKIIGGYLLPSMQVGVPKDKREADMDTTSFMMETLDDYKMFNIEEIYLPLSNFSFVCPNAIETVKYSLMAGLTSLGTTSQLSWDYPGCDDHIEIVENVTRAIGIIKEKEEYGPGLSCYIEDGLAACCVDCVGLVASYMFDKYIYYDLCGLPISCGFGALVSDVKTRAALIKALDDIAHECGSSLSFVHASTTTQWDHDVNANFGPSSVEMLMTMLAEDRYKTGAEFQVVPVTESITVPTQQELQDIIAAASRVSEYVDTFRDMIDWTEIEERAEILKREGRKMFQNILDNLEEAGVDIKDPVPLLKFIKSVDAALFEEAYHPSVREKGYFEPWFPNDMGYMTMEAVEEALAELDAEGITRDALKGKRILVGSTDVHAYGVRFINSTLTALGAEIEDIGVDNSAQSMIDSAIESGIEYVCASSHSGNALAVGTHFEKYMKEKNLSCKIFMGGVLTTILPGHSEPSNVEKMINEKEGVLATNNIVELVKAIQA